MTAYENSRIHFQLVFFTGDCKGGEPFLLSWLKLWIPNHDSVNSAAVKAIRYKNIILQIRNAILAAG